MNLTENGAQPAISEVVNKVSGLGLTLISMESETGVVPHISDNVI